MGYLPQAITLGTRRTVSDLLGITAARAALHAIEAGETGADVYATVGDDWDVEERARAWLDRLGLAHLGLDDRVERLSGGETIRVALAALFLRRPDILLLDEPTNNLDLDARKRLYDAVASWTGVMVIVSHDRELLGLVDQIADLSGGEIRMYGGNLDAYEELLTAEQAAAERAVTTAAADVRREQRDLVEAQVKQARRDRMGRQVAASGGLPRIVAHARKRAAQETAGRSRELHSERLEAARDRLEEAEQAVRDDAEIRVDLPGTAVPAGRTVLTVTGLDGAHWHPAARSPTAASAARPSRRGRRAASRRAPARSRRPPACNRRPAGQDARGSHRARPGAHRPHRTERRGQDDPAPRDRGPGGTPGHHGPAGRGHRLPAAAPRHPRRLAERGRQRAGSRPGRVGERGPGQPGPVPVPRRRGPNAWPARCPAASGSVPSSRPCCSPSRAPQLLLLDEPTNNLDMASVRQLSQALAGYRGAILVASHDVPFLRSAGITRWLRLDRDAGLAEIDPP